MVMVCVVCIYCVVCIEFGGLVAEVLHVWWSRYIMGRSRDSSLLRCGLVAEVLHVWWSRYIMGGRGTHLC